MTDLQKGEDTYVKALQQIFTDPEVRKALEAEPEATMERLGLDLDDEARATLRSSAELGSPDGPVSDLPPRSPRHAIRLIVVFVPSTHGPPGTSVSLAPPVLRI